MTVEIATRLVCFVSAAITAASQACAMGGEIFWKMTLNTQ